MQLKEIFDRPMKWEVTVENKLLKIYKFMVRDQPYVIHFIARRNDEVFPGLKGPVWTIYMEAPDAKGATRATVLNNGASIAAFSTAIAVIKDFMSTHKGEYLIFSAVEDNRQKLYSALVKKFVSWWKRKSKNFRIFGEKWYCIKI